MKRRPSRLSIFILLFDSLISILSVNLFAQAELPTSELKKLSVEELMNVEVTSVNRRSEKFSKTASAIQVITQRDIQQFGATTLPEALRLASNLEVMQVGSGQWTVSARGFNSSIGNKLLVLIDGRTVYSPLFAGVFWDIQNVLLDDVDRIEVISGPGGTAWGANAVNGVINIITKNASQSRGLLLKASTGNELKGQGAVQYGGSIIPDLDFRVYGKYTRRDDAVFADSKDAHDGWDLGQSGFRMDWNEDTKNTFTLQGDFFESKIRSFRPDSSTLTKGGNLLARWTHATSEDANFKIQFYYDRVHRDQTGAFNDILNTYDLDGQYQFRAGSRHQLVTGIGYRLADDNFTPGTVSFSPRHMELETYSAFIQDEVALKEDRLYLIAGSKFQHNSYTGFEYQPSIRLAWYLNAKQQTLWTAVSRAVRMPSRIDRDYVVPAVSAGGSHFRSEIVYAYEAGYRIQPIREMFVSASAYFNVYDKIRSVELNDISPPQFEIGNGLFGESYGAELTMDYQVSSWWRMHLGYTFLHLNIWTRPWSTDISGGNIEANDPNQMIFLRSSFNLTNQLKLYPAFRYISAIQSTMDVPAYAELDARIAWEPTANIDFSVVGQNLLHHHHTEFGYVNSRKEIERSFYLRFVWRY